MKIQFEVCESELATIGTQNHWRMMKSLNTRILWCWTLYCIVGCSLLPEVVMGARYLPTRRSIPTQLERNERLRELFQHVSLLLHHLTIWILTHRKMEANIFMPEAGPYRREAKSIHLHTLRWGEGWLFFSFFVWIDWFSRREVKNGFYFSVSKH